MAVGCAISIVVGADSFLDRVAIGTLGDRAEVEVLSSAGGGRDAEREGVGGGAIDAVGTAAGLASNGAGGGRAGICRREIEDGSETEQHRGVLHCEEEGILLSMNLKN